MINLGNSFCPFNLNSLWRLFFSSQTIGKSSVQILKIVQLTLSNIISSLSLSWKTEWNSRRLCILLFGAQACLLFAFPIFYLRKYMFTETRIKFLRESLHVILFFCSNIFCSCCRHQFARKQSSPDAIFFRTININKKFTDYLKKYL